MEYRYRREDDDEESSSEEESGNNNNNSGRPYECMFCRRGFTTAQALGGHMNIHRKDRASANNNNNKPISTFGSSASTTKHDTSSIDHLDHLAFYSPIPTPISINNIPPPPPNSSSSNYSHHTQSSHRAVPSTTPSHLQYSRLLQCVQQNQHNLQDHQDDGLDLELRLGYHHHHRHHP